MKHIILSVALCAALGGCGQTTSDKPAGTFTQEGVVDVTARGPVEVFYPEPFASTPNLTFPKHDWIQLAKEVEQRPDGFRVKVLGHNPAPGSSKLHWRAEGLRRKAQ